MFSPPARMQAAVIAGPRACELRTVDAPAASHDQVVIQVEDSGTGFPPDLLTRAFEPFTGSGAENGNGAGAGLGLSIVRAVAEAHGGTARAENLPGGGARLTLTLKG